MKATPTQAVPFQDLPDCAPLRVHQFLGTLVPVGRSTWYRWVAEGRAPKPVALGPRVVVWTAGTLREWLRAQAATA
jgi:predicted DNA-binding transcriptional regulator AlpA